MYVVKIKIRDVSVTANREGIFVTWDDGGDEWIDSYSVTAVDPRCRDCQQFKTLPTKDAKALHISSDQLSTINTIELNITAISSIYSNLSKDPVIITVQLEQDQGINNKCLANKFPFELGSSVNHT